MYCNGSIFNETDVTFGCRPVLVQVFSSTLSNDCLCLCHFGFEVECRNCSLEVEAADPPWDPKRLRWLRLMEPAGYKRPENQKKLN